MSGAVGVGVRNNLHLYSNIRNNNHLVTYSSSSLIKIKRKRRMLSSSFYYNLSNNNLIYSSNTRSLSIRCGVVVETTTGAQYSSSSSESSFRRRLILLRHAHSSFPPNNNSLRDHDRPLSKSGQADAIRVSNKLQQLGWIPQLILSSDAARTKETLAIMQEQVREILDAEVHYISSFYSIAAMDGQTAQHLQHAICKLSRDEISTVMCMGHNRGWEEAASMFSGKLVELKTCNAALLEATGKTWKEAFSLAGFGGWKLQAIVKPNSSLESL